MRSYARKLARLRGDFGEGMGCVGQGKSLNIWKCRGKCVFFCRKVTFGHLHFIYILGLTVEGKIWYNICCYWRSFIVILSNARIRGTYGKGRFRMEAFLPRSTLVDFGMESRE